MSSAGIEGLPVDSDLQVEPAEAGLRLDVFLAQRLEVSRAEVRRLLVRGGVRWDGRLVGWGDKGVRLESGDRIQVGAFAPPEARAPLPEPEEPLTVLAEGPGWVAVDKAPGQPVHPLRGDERGTALNALVARHPEVLGVGEGGLRSGVVHRLDVDTSGVLLFALDAATWERLRGAFRQHRVEKRYRALVRGRLEGEGEEVLDLEVAQHRPARVRVRRRRFGELPRRQAELRWRSVELFGRATLLEVQPRTGFLHQIRVTLAQRGHPVLGDRTYGDPERDPVPASRHLLHAAHLRLEEVEAASPDPADLAAVHSILRAG